MVKNQLLYSNISQSLVMCFIRGCDTTDSIDLLKPAYIVNNELANEEKPGHYVL